MLEQILVNEINTLVKDCNDSILTYKIIKDDLKKYPLKFGDFNIPLKLDRNFDDYLENVKISFSNCIKYLLEREFGISTKEEFSIENTVDYINHIFPDPKLIGLLQLKESFLKYCYKIRGESFKIRGNKIITLIDYFSTKELNLGTKITNPITKEIEIYTLRTVSVFGHRSDSSTQVHKTLIKVLNEFLGIKITKLNFNFNELIPYNITIGLTNDLSLRYYKNGNIKLSFKKSKQCDKFLSEFLNTKA